MTKDFATLTHEYVESAKALQAFVQSLSGRELNEAARAEFRNLRHILDQTHRDWYLEITGIDLLPVVEG